MSMHHLNEELASPRQQRFSDATDISIEFILLDEVRIIAKPWIAQVLALVASPLH